jgi:hypothetical protein
VSAAPVPVTPALAGALRMLEHGIAVQPCHVEIRQSDGRKILSNLVEDWQSHGATRDQVLRAFANAGANAYLIACGPSGIVVADLDVKNGVDGIASWTGRPTGGVVVKTVSGGRHHYYRNDAQIGCPGSGLAGVDIKGIGGGVFGPGSLDGAYAIESWLPLTDWSGVGLELAAKRERKPLTYEPGWRPGNIFCDWTPSQAQRVLADSLAEITDHITTKGWLDSGFRKLLLRKTRFFGGFIGTGYLDEADAYEQLANAIRATGHEPDDDDVEIIESGLEVGAQDPVWVATKDPAPVDDLPKDLSSGVATNEEPSGRRRVDLRPFLDGTYMPPLPTVGQPREDGAYLLYPGRWHVLAGLTTAGKTMFALWQAIGVMCAGGTVAYLHFEEINPSGTIDRLRTLGGDKITDDMIENQFVWLSCEARWGAGLLAGELELLEEPAELVVLDGINAAVAQHGGDINSTDSITLYRRLLVAPAVATGATVLSLGHPVKDRTRQEERHSFGSTAWLDEVDGVGFRLEASPNTPISKGRYGSSALYSTKDRYGQVESSGVLHKDREAGWYYLGQFSIDNSQEETQTRFAMPHSAAAEVPVSSGRKESTADTDARVITAVAKLLDAGDIATSLNVSATAQMKKSRVIESLARLSTGTKKLIEVEGPRRSRAYLINQHYSDSFGIFSDDQK